MKELWSKRERE